MATPQTAGSTGRPNTWAAADRRLSRSAGRRGARSGQFHAADSVDTQDTQDDNVTHRGFRDSLSQDDLLDQVVEDPLATATRGMISVPDRIISPSDVSLRYRPGSLEDDHLDDSVHLIDFGDRDDLGDDVRTPTPSNVGNVLSGSTASLARMRSPSEEMGMLPMHVVPRDSIESLRRPDSLVPRDRRPSGAVSGHGSRKPSLALTGRPPTTDFSAQVGEEEEQRVPPPQPPPPPHSRTGSRQSGETSPSDTEHSTPVSVVSDRSGMTDRSTDRSERPSRPPRKRPSRDARESFRSMRDSKESRDMAEPSGSRPTSRDSREFRQFRSSRDSTESRKSKEARSESRDSAPSVSSPSEGRSPREKRSPREDLPPRGSDSPREGRTSREKHSPRRSKDKRSPRHSPRDDLPPRDTRRSPRHSPREDHPPQQDTGKSRKEEPPEDRDVPEEDHRSTHKDIPRDEHPPADWDVPPEVARRVPREEHSPQDGDTPREAGTHAPGEDPFQDEERHPARDRPSSSDEQLGPESPAERESPLWGGAPVSRLPF